MKGTKNILISFDLFKEVFRNKIENYSQFIIPQLLFIPLWHTESNLLQYLFTVCCKTNYILQLEFFDRSNLTNLSAIIIILQLLFLQLPFNALSVRVCITRHNVTREYNK